jgi:hypothetical protein
VTEDESQVSVGGLLALDQVLRKPWSSLTTFWTSTHWSRKECPSGADIIDITYFVGYVYLTRGLYGFCNGLWDVDPWGLPMTRPYYRGL